MSISKPNPQKTAAERLAKGTASGENSSPDVVSNPSEPVSDNPKPGRPKGSTNKPKDGATEKPKTAEELEQEARMSAFLFATVWGISTTFTKHRDISDDEALNVGRALAPVLAKYLPSMAGYALEINLLLGVGMVWTSTAPPKKKPEEMELISGDGNIPEPKNRLSMEE